jgi:hypothetical protein
VDVDPYQILRRGAHRARAGRHQSSTRRGRQVGSQRRELGVSPGSQRAFQAVIQFFRGEPSVPGGYPQQFHYLIPVRV